MTTDDTQRAFLGQSKLETIKSDFITKKKLTFLEIVFILVNQNFQNKLTGSSYFLRFSLKKLL